MAAARRLSRPSCWRHAVTATYRSEANAAFARLSPSVREGFCHSSAADFRIYGVGGVRDRGFEISDLPVDVAGFQVSSAYRDGLFARDGVSQNAFGCTGGFSDGALPPGFLLHVRGLAAKAKKAKSKVEVHSELTEDVVATSKAFAVKMMETALDAVSREHAKLRTGRASAGMLDHIIVEAHGVRTPLNHIAAVTVSGLQTLNVLPYDASVVKEVEKAILNSPMGLNPQVDGATMTVPLPRLTKEYCETMCKVVSKSGEASKLTIRRARKEALDTAKNSGDLSKDEIKRFEKEIEELTKKYTKSIDDACKNKEKEIMA